MSNLALAHPMALLALLLLPLYAFLRRRRWRQDAVPLAPLQYRPPGSKSKDSRTLRRVRLPLELLVLSLVILALAGPHRRNELELSHEDGIDIALVLDISLSMLAEDFPPNRLEVLRGFARDFIQRGGGHRIGLFVFGKDVYMQSPLTTNTGLLLSMLDGVSVHAISASKSGGTAIGDALLSAADHLQSIRLEGRDQAVILITDGASNEGVEPAFAARYLRHLDIRTYMLGIGGEEPVQVKFQGELVGGDTPYLAVLDDAQLREVAELSEGMYFRATDVSAFEEIFAHLSRLEATPLEVETLIIRRDITWILAAVAFLLFAAYLHLAGWLLRRPLR